MFKEKDIINENEIDEEECGIYKTHEAAYDYFKNKAKENYENADTLLLNTNQIFSDEEMYDKTVYCPKCSKPLIKGSMSYDRAVVSWDNGTNPEGDIGLYDVYECDDCKKVFALMPTEINYNGNHGIFYTGGKSFLCRSEEEILHKKIKDKMLKSIEQYTRRIKAGESGIDSWNLNCWLWDGVEHYIKKFSEWEASEQIIDDKKAIWMLKKPDSQYQKVCLYRDGCNMFIYGDYGQFTFDSMTWLGSVYNLEYDNIGYQMEKLNYESKQSLYVFDDSYCKEDILDWLEDRIENRYYDIVDEDEELPKLIKKAKEFLSGSSYFCSCDIEEFCEENNCGDIKELLNFTTNLLDYTDEFEWITHLRSVSSDLEDYDEPCESSLWKAGKRINQRYFVCMYALQVCGEKLEAVKEGGTNELSS